MRVAFRTTTALMAKEATAARAAIRRMAEFRWRRSAETDARAKASPRMFSASGPLVVDVAEDGRVGDDSFEAGVAVGRFGRRRRCSRRAAAPMAATTTMATGLRNALRLV